MRQYVTKTVVYACAPCRTPSLQTCKRLFPIINLFAKRTIARRGIQIRRAHRFDRLKPSVLATASPNYAALRPISGLSTAKADAAIRNVDCPPNHAALRGADGPRPIARRPPNSGVSYDSYVWVLAPRDFRTILGGNAYDPYGTRALDLPPTKGQKTREPNNPQPGVPWAPN